MSVQPNLVGRDGQLQKELERMRMLASKLAFQIEKAKLEAPRGEEDEEIEGGDEGIEKRLRGILEGV